MLISRFDGGIANGTASPTYGLILGITARKYLRYA